MNTIRDLLEAKGHEICSVSPDDTVFEALKLMADMNIGAVLVIDDSGHLAGILSERDYARKIVLRGQTSKDTPVRSIMTDKVICIAADKTVHECMALMTADHIRHVPVMDRDKLVGVVSIGDVGKAIISDQGFVIGQLERYIYGTR
jgi:CBS domain-containing protein